jgi:hypothetical protein
MKVWVPYEELVVSPVELHTTGKPILNTFSPTT